MALPLPLRSWFDLTWFTLTENAPTKVWAFHANFRRFINYQHVFKYLCYFPLKVNVTPHLFTREYLSTKGNRFPEKWPSLLTDKKMIKRPHFCEQKWIVNKSFYSISFKILYNFCFLVNTLVNYPRLYKYLRIDVFYYSKCLTTFFCQLIFKLYTQQIRHHACLLLNEWQCVICGIYSSKTFYCIFICLFRIWKNHIINISIFFSFCCRKNIMYSDIKAVVSRKRFVVVSFKI